MILVHSRQNMPYYYVVSYCVWRVFLCGRDAHSGQRAVGSNNEAYSNDSE